MTFVLLLGIAMLVGAAFLVAQVATLPARQRRASIGRATRYSRIDAGLRQELPELRVRVLTPVMTRIAAFVERVFPNAGIESIEKRLISAGLGLRISAPGFLVLKGGMALAGLTIGALAGSSSGGALRGLLLGLAFGAAFFVLPDRLLAGRIRDRKERIEAELPDALDLLAVSVEAGLSLDGAVAQLIEHMDGPLIDELAGTLGQMRIGESRQAALRKLAERADVPGITALARAVIQSDQLGISLGRILRNQARDARQRRQAAAEERANKMPVKMLFPTIIFIFPALFLVILGPALISLFKVL